MNWVGIKKLSTTKMIVLLYCKYYDNKHAIMKESNITFSHLHKICTMLESEGFITLKKVGRKQVIKLTKLGNIIHGHLLLVNDKIVKGVDK